MRRPRILAALVLTSVAFAVGSATDVSSQAKPPITAGFRDGTADVNGIRLHYVAAGRGGQLMLFLHGFFNFSHYWAEQLAEFGQDHLAVAPDLRGYGRSSRPDMVEQYQLQYLIEDVRQLAHHLNGGKPFTLVGHDWGGLIAFVFAMHYPELVDRLIVANAPHPQVFEREVNENPWQRFASTYMLRMTGYGHADEPVFPDTMSMATALARVDTGFVGEQIKLGRYSAQDRQRWLDALTAPNAWLAGRNYYRANNLNPPFNDTHPRSEVARSWSTAAVTTRAKALVLPMPTLILWGMNDPALPEGNLTGLDPYFARLRIRLFPNGTHNASQELYEQVNAEIRHFLAGRDADRKELVVMPRSPS